MPTTAVDSRPVLRVSGTDFRVTASLVPCVGEEFSLEDINGRAEPVTVTVGRRGQSCSCYSFSKGAGCDHLQAVLLACRENRI